METFETKILTPHGSVFEGKVIGVQVPGTEGSFEVLSGHADILSNLDVGLVRIKKNEYSTEVFTVAGGTVEVSNSGMIILSSASEKVKEIDVERAQESLQRAKERKGKREFDQRRVEASMLRSLNRIAASRRGF